VRPFEDGLLRLFRDKHKKILETIRTEKEISDKTGEQLKKAVSDYAKSFAA
jgi:F-type H+/Na+-transporting ATPase subunit alpha